MVKKLLMLKIQSFTNLLAVGILLVGLASCSGEIPGGGCVKCIENKPALTPYASTLNSKNHFITLDMARTMTQSFSAQREMLLAPERRGQNVLPLYETFNLKTIDSLLCQEKAVGFRIYMALDGQQKARFVLVGVDGDGKDIMQRVVENPAMLTEAPTGTSVLVAEEGQRYP